MDEEETEKYKQLGSGNIDATGSRVVGFDNATFIWGGKDDVARDGSQAFKMIDLDLHFTLDRLNIIAGPTGSGKTSLLMALLGEMTMIDGKVYLPGGYDRASLIADSVTGLTESVAYCAQQAWLLNGTVKENILFSSPLDSKRYEDVLKACALGPDIKIWADGDATLVGEKGMYASLLQTFITFVRACRGSTALQTKSRSFECSSTAILMMNSNISQLFRLLKPNQ